MCRVFTTIFHFLVCGIFILGLSLIAFGQLGSGLQGTVTDQNGAIIPGANVKLTNTETNQSVETTANDSGLYRFTGLKQGTYNVLVTQNGFKKKLVEKVNAIKIGSPEDYTNFMNAVIDEKSFDKLESYIKGARKRDSGAKVWVGGKCDKTEGFFIEPTIIEATDPQYVTMCEELFGPVLTIYVYDENQFEETLELVDSTSIYALTGAILANDRYAIELATKKLLQNLQKYKAK